jgi:hypothetical protein
MRLIGVRSAFAGDQVPAVAEVDEAVWLGVAPRGRSAFSGPVPEAHGLSGPAGERQRHQNAGSHVRRPLGRGIGRRGDGLDPRTELGRHRLGDLGQCGDRCEAQAFDAKCRA